MFGFKNSHRGQIISSILLIILIIFTSVFAYVSLTKKNFSPIFSITSSGNQKSLQLQTFYPSRASTPKPTPVTIVTTPNATCGIAASSAITTDPRTGKCCVADGPSASAAGCCEGVGYSSYPNGAAYLNITQPFVWCDAKPVIYLYPESPINVSVSLKIPGLVTESIPQIQGNTWENITAHLDGHLFYKGKAYSELFYETSQERSLPPKTGLVVYKSDLKTTLTMITNKLGLNYVEQTEFLDYWLSRLNSIKSSKILVSIFSPEDKAKIDNVTISPKPDVFINFIMYFKGVSDDYKIDPLILPDKAPTRHGFTAVEWGGILD